MRNSRLNWTTACLVSLGIVLVGKSARELCGPRRELKAEPSREAQLAQELGDLFSRVAEEVKLSVVSIETQEPAAGDDRPLRVETHPSEKESIGSGFIIDSRGYILTNHHLVGGAEKIIVRLNDNRELAARSIQSDQSSDLALIKIDAEDLHAIPLGDSDLVRVGQWVLAIGNPFGLTQTVSAGIVSALKRCDLKILPQESFIQTDASINPGNSGGPLVNLRGEAIGINTAIFASSSGGNQGIGFAVPIQLARTLVKRWMEGKGASYVGVMPSKVDSDMAHYYGLKELTGAFLARVDPEGPAATAGLRAKDVILAFDGTEVRDESHLRVLIAGSTSNEPLEVLILRNGKRETLRVVPRERETPPNSPRNANPQEDEPAKTRLLGITVTPVNQRVAAQLGLEPESKGVVILEVQPGSAAQKKGLRPADVIVEVNERPVTGLDELKAALELTSSVAMLRVERGNGELGYVFLPR